MATANAPISTETRNYIEDHVALLPRDVVFDWGSLPNHYVYNEPFATHWADVLHLLLPAGEEFFVEVFKQALPLIKDDQLRADVQGFIAQEAMHSQAHHSVLDRFEAKGLDVKPYTDQMRWLFLQLLGDRPHWSKRAQQKWMLERVSFIAAIEHYTAILGKWVLTAGLDGKAHPVMIDLLRWHGAEEVEHKSVAFDVMKHLNAGFFRQVRTQFLITPFLFLLWVRGVRFMYSIDPELPQGTKARWRDWRAAWRKGLTPAPFDLIRAVAKYYLPSFHPSDLGGIEMAIEYLAKSPAAH